MNSQVTKTTIPPKDRKEWMLLVTGQIDHGFQNFVLQLKCASYQEKIREKTITPEQAIDEMYALCQKYSLAVQSDFKKIFKEW